MSETDSTAAKIDRPGMGIFCTAARTEFLEKYVSQVDGDVQYAPLNDILKFINYVAKNAYDLGKGEASK